MDDILKNLLFDVATAQAKVARMKKTYSTYLLHLLAEASKSEVKKMHNTGRGTYAEVEYDGHLYKINIEV